LVIDLDFRKIFDKFNDLKVVIIGDVMLDAYWEGEVDRISPEAPVPIIHLRKNESRLGGAANVALNLVALGAMPILCSCVGTDEQATRLTDLLKKSRISDAGLIYSPQRTTTIKTRVIGNNQHLLRIDSEQVIPIQEHEEDLLIQRVETILRSGVDVVIFEDYNKGVLTPRVIRESIALAQQYGAITSVDPKKDNFFEYQHVTLFKPNLKELTQGLNVSFSYADNPETLPVLVQQLEDKLHNRISFVTMSQYGVYIKEGSEQGHFPAHIRNVSDVSGAGDTVISVASLCLALEMPIHFIATIANIAGGLVCEQRGVVSINKQHLLHEIERLQLASM